MISIRLPLALIITAILSIAAYLAEQNLSQSSISPFLASIFVLLTVLFLSIPTLLSAVNNVDSAVTKSPTVQKPANTDQSITTLYVGNLPYKANEMSVKTLFEEIGAVTSVRLMKDRKTGRRKGFGFVEVEAAKLDIFIEKLNDSEYMDRTIKVRPAKDKQE